MVLRSRRVLPLAVHLAVLGLLTAGLLVWPGASAQAAPPVFKAPYACGQRWTASTYSGHGGNGNAVDFNLYPGQADFGQPVLASADGFAEFFWDESGGNLVRINHGGGWYTLYMHLATVSFTNPVREGDQIGTVGSTGNSTAPHLHYVQRLDGVSQPVAFDGVRIPVGRAYTAADPLVTSTNCIQRDGDADGMRDALDRCPELPGSAANEGCPGPMVATTVRTEAPDGWFTGAPLAHSATIRNTSAAPVPVSLLAITVQDPLGLAHREICATGLTLAPGESRTCTARGSWLTTGRYAAAADWRDTSGGWHTGELGAPAAFSLARPGLVSVTPARVLDTRAGRATVDGVAAGTGILGPGGSVDVPVLGRAQVPAEGVAAVVVNVTGISPSTGTYLSVYPAGSVRPLASTLNLSTGQIYANAAVVRPGAGGAITLTNAAGSTHAAIDVVGYYPARGGFVPLAPARLTDTRPGERTVDGRQAGDGALGPGATRRVVVAGRAGVPARGVAAVVVNLTGIAPSQSTYLTAHASDVGRPLASTVNLNPGFVVPNLAVVKVGADGAIAVFNDSGTTDVVVDVLGYIPATPNPYTAVTPTRIVDTRTSGAPLGPGANRAIQVAGRGGIPADATAVVVNLTGVQPTTGTYLVAYPDDVGRPVASTLNLAGGDIRATTAVVRLSPDGRLAVFNAAGQTHVLVDVVGYTR